MMSCSKAKNSRRIYSEDSKNEGNKGERHLLITNQQRLEFNWPLYVPYFPFAFNRNYTKKLGQECIEYCNSLSYFKGIKRNIYSVSWFNAVAYPLCQNMNRFKNIIIFHNLTTFVDDSTDNYGEIVGRDSAKAEKFYMELIGGMDALLNNESYDTSKWKAFMVGIIERVKIMLESYTSVQKRRFVHIFKDYCLANIEECKGFFTNEKFTTADYAMKVQISSKLCRVCYQLIEYTQEIELTDEEWADPLLTKLVDLVGLITILTNDWYSFRKEIEECEGNMELNKNSISLFMVKENLSLQESVDKCVQMLRESDQKFSDIEKELRKGKLSKSVKEYLKALKYWVGGNWLFHIKDERYHGVEYEGVTPLAGKFIYDRNKTIIVPEEGIEDKFRFLVKFYEYDSE